MPLILLPNVFAEAQSSVLLLPEGLDGLVASLDGLIAESERAGRRYLARYGKKSLPLFLLNEHSAPNDYEELAEQICAGMALGLISDAGVPAVADPGSYLVHRLRARGYAQIQAIPGPCSIFLALMLSGFDGQNFSFHGYLPKEPDSRKAAIRSFESRGGTHICIETPYRNNALLSDLVSVLRDTTEVCVAASLTCATQSVLSKSVKMWKREKHVLPKEPSVFLLYAKRPRERNPVEEKCSGRKPSRPPAEYGCITPRIL